MLELFEQTRYSVRYLEHGYPCELVRWHYHDEYELHFIAEGSGRAFVGNHIGRFDAGQLVLTGPWVPHNWISDCAPGQHIALRDRVVHFDRQIIEDATVCIPEFSEIRSLLAAARYGVQIEKGDDWAEHWMLEIKNASDAARFGHFCCFLQELSRKNYSLLSSSGLSSAKADLNRKKLQKIVEYVLDKSSENIYLHDISEFIGMSEDYFSQFFHRSTGRRFTDFVNGVRINKACDLLANTNLRVSEICFEVGFNNIANFNRRFKNIKHMTPTAYRHRIRSASVIMG